MGQEKRAGVEVRVAGPVPKPPAQHANPFVVASSDPEAPVAESSARPEGDAAPAAPATGGAGEAMDPMRSAVELRRRHDDLIARERAEPVDSSWAPTAARSLEGELASVTERMNSRLINVHCATTLCTATVEWNTYPQAEETHASLLHASYEPNCAVQVLLPEPANRAAAYQATAVFDCEGVRAQ